MGDNKESGWVDSVKQYNTRFRDMDNIAVRGVDSDIYREVRAVCAYQKLKMGGIISEALALWLKTQETVIYEIEATEETTGFSSTILTFIKRFT